MEILPPQATLTAAAINVAASGDNQLVAAVAGKRVYVYRFFLKAGGAVSMKFRSATTDFHPALSMAAGEGWALDLTAEPWFVTAVGEALNLNLSGAVQTSGMLYYLQR